MRELVADRAAILELAGPRDDEADAPPTAARIGLVGGEGGIGDLRPPGRVYRRSAPSADPPLALDIDFDRQGREPGEAPVEMQRPSRAGRAGAAVIRREREDRVVEL